MFGPCCRYRPEQASDCLLRNAISLRKPQLFSTCDTLQWIQAHLSHHVRNTGLKATTTNNRLEIKLELMTCYRCFVPNFARIKAAVSAELKEIPRLLDHLSSCEADSSATLQQSLISPVALALPCSEGLLILDIAVGEKEFGCMLMQALRE